jgi:nucleotide-binding universal stress UspA family protein
MSDRIRAIVAGVGGHAEHELALAAAVQLGRRSGATVHAVHAFMLPAVFTSLPGVDYVDAKGVQAYTERVKAGIAARVERDHPRAGVVCHAVLGPAHEALAETARAVGAGLLVVGAARQGRLARSILGTTAQRVIPRATVPVYVARAAHRPPERVLLTSDLSELSAGVHERGLDVVDSVYGDAGAALRSLLVITFGILPLPLPRGALDRAALAELGTFLDARRPRELPVERRVRQGDPAEQIAAEARDWPADLVILGTHARTGTDRLLLGSVAEAALRDLPCDALVIPPIPVSVAEAARNPSASVVPHFAA